MSFYSALFTYLQTQAGLTNLVGIRMYPVRLPQKPTLPALVIEKIAKPRVYSQSGDSNLANPTYQFDCWAKTHEDAVALQAELDLALSGFKGTMETTEVGAAFILNVIDDFEPDTALYRQIVDVEFWHKD